MAEQINFTSEGKILFNAGQIVFNCECCDGVEPCEVCDTDTTPATQDITIAGVVADDCGAAGDCDDLNATITLAQEVAPCAWRFQDTGLNCGMFLLLTMEDIGGGMARINLDIGSAGGEVTFRKELAFPFDCSATHTLDYFAGPSGFIPCDLSAVLSVQLN